ncbi:phage tail terminator protein [Listeria newyorkensis]|uniref:Minor capsid protein n=1 Tax=Listeria newyorkensis TaxID=1497681 RepID=A0A841Z1Q7_9LIST|nr:minor capsid protein [Listeria newyorkensis]MBC1459072.1 hypothetical protein [Listeria newyorkensis]
MRKAFFETVKTHLETDLNLFSAVRMSVLDIDEEDIVFRFTPSSPGIRYMDKTVTKNIVFQILVKHSDRLTVMNTIENIAEALELSDGELSPEDGSFSFTQCEIYTEPSEIDITAKKLFIWSAMFRAEIHKNKEE